jgi:hypothetical protein
MRRIIQAEEVLLFLLSIAALYYLDVAWWYYLILIIGPDISMVGYIAGNKTGAILYNLFHHKGIAVILFLTGVYFNSWHLQVYGIILFGHSAMDRVFGYGLKYYEGFHHTHLGNIEKQKPISVNQTLQ